MQGQLETQRRLTTMLIHRWQQTGTAPEALSGRVVQCIKECMNTPGVFEAAKQAVDMGWLDADSSKDENPVKWYLREKAAQDTPQGELGAWEKVALRNVNKAKRFEVKALPLDVETAVRSKLVEYTNKDRVKIVNVFDQARKAIDDNPPGTVSETELESWYNEIIELGDPELLKLIEEQPHEQETRKSASGKGDDLGGGGGGDAGRTDATGSGDGGDSRRDEVRHAGGSGDTGAAEGTSPTPPDAKSEGDAGLAPDRSAGD
jgi:hypothetical protein